MTTPRRSASDGSPLTEAELSTIHLIRNTNCSAWQLKAVSGSPGVCKFCYRERNRVQADGDTVRRVLDALHTEAIARGPVSTGGGPLVPDDNHMEAAVRNASDAGLVINLQANRLPLSARLGGLHSSTSSEFKPPAAVFDIDGTVADCRHRIHHATAEPPDWDAFFAGSDLDRPFPQGVTLALKYAAHGHLIWLTGRPEKYRRATVAWLQAFGLPATRLYMRPINDLRPAPIFKAEYLTHLAVQHDVVVVVDDDDRVVAALHQAGWPVQRAQWTPL